MLRPQLSAALEECIRLCLACYGAADELRPAH
jgi:hypothetical protein